jgi:streptomycin 6-kinase
MPGDFEFPTILVQTNIDQRGEQGVEWLEKLPGVLAEIERRWSLTIGKPFEGLSYNYAAPAVRADGTTLVVKVCPPSREFRTEAEALALYGGNGAVELIDADTALGVMLLEHVRPGKMLVEVKDDEEATQIAASVMPRIWHPPPPENAFPTVADWARGMEKLRAMFGGTTGPFPEVLVREAEGLFSELIGSMGEVVVLHGDLHHFNILSSDRQGWLAIDPQGVIGEREYEVGALLRNPMPYIYHMGNVEKLLARRMDQLAEQLGFDRQRIRGWGVAQAVLSAWWFFEDFDGKTSGEMMNAIALAEAMARVK